MKTPVFPLKVFYDGGCIVCAGEMAMYRKKDRDGRLIFVDISDRAFAPEPFGFTLADFMAQLHAIDCEGRVFRGVEAFRAIWQAFPASALYGILGALTSFPGVALCARFGYALFARFRRYLPRRKDTCTSGLCSFGKRP